MPKDSVQTHAQRITKEAGHSGIFDDGIKRTATHLCRECGELAEFKRDGYWWCSFWCYDAGAEGA